MPETNNADELLTVKQVSELKGLSENRVRELIRANKLPAQRFGATYVVKSEDLSLLDGRKPGRPSKDKAGRE